MGNSCTSVSRSRDTTTYPLFVLVIATHGRSFYVLDDIAPLRQWDDDPSRAVHLFRPTDAVRRLYPAHVDFYVSDEPSAARIEILDAAGNLARELPANRLKRGHNRVTWDLRYPGATVFEGMVLESPSPTRGPLAPSGTYRVRLHVDGESVTESFRLVKDPDTPS